MDEPVVERQRNLDHYTGDSPRTEAYCLGKHLKIEMQVKWEYQEYKDVLSQSNGKRCSNFRARETCKKCILKVQEIRPSEAKRSRWGNCQPMKKDRLNEMVKKSPVSRETESCH